MKRVSLSFAFALCAAMATAAANAPAASVPAASDKPVVVKAEVVSTDASANKLTYKTSAGGEKTAAVSKEAAASLKSLKAGDKVTLTLKEAGDEETVLSVHKGSPKTSSHSQKKNTSKKS